MEEKKLTKSKPHSITIEGRERLIINGVRMWQALMKTKSHWKQKQEALL